MWNGGVEQSYALFPGRSTGQGALRRTLSSLQLRDTGANLGLVKRTHWQRVEDRRRKNSERSGPGPRTGGKVEHAYQLIRDYFVFTDKRFVLVDKQGVTGSKVEYHSIPYKGITHFSIETAGTFDLDASLKDLDHRNCGNLEKAVQQEVEHQRGPVGAGQLCAQVVASRLI